MDFKMKKTEKNIRSACGTINLSILDFKIGRWYLVLGAYSTINLSILDFKKWIEFDFALCHIPINLSILDFKTFRVKVVSPYLTL